MTDTLQPHITLEEAKRINLEEAEHITLGEVQGDAYGNLNGFSYKRSVEIDRSGFDTTSTAVSR